VTLKYTTIFCCQITTLYDIIRYDIKKGAQKMPSKLEELAHKNSRQKMTANITVRVPQELHAKFKVKCIQLGISINEAILMLLESEVEESHQQIPPQNEVKTSSHKMPSENKVENVQSKSEAKKQQQKSTPKFNYVEPTPRVYIDEYGDEIIDETPDWQWEKINAHPSYFKPNEEE
jgi:antitoxin component of RelBE/YafQ-DinJ toxin-antitoxin module